LFTHRTPKRNRPGPTQARQIRCPNCPFPAAFPAIAFPHQPVYCNRLPAPLASFFNSLDPIPPEHHPLQLSRPAPRGTLMICTFASVITRRRSSRRPCHPYKTNGRTSPPTVYLACITDFPFLGDIKLSKFTGATVKSIGLRTVPPPWWFAFPPPRLLPTHPSLRKGAVPPSAREPALEEAFFEPSSFPGLAIHFPTDARHWRLPMKLRLRPFPRGRRNSSRPAPLPSRPGFHSFGGVVFLSSDSLRTSTFPLRCLFSANPHEL